ncbi:MAG: hypothetical protein H0T56_15040 [Pseudaminobacter sp.]|nr:hypothetical protein [Pseudaminobacter sp.]
MNHATTLVLTAGLLGAGFVSYDAVGDPQTPAVSLAAQRISATDTETVRLQSYGGAVSCEAVRGEAIAPGQSALHVDDDCASLIPGMERAKFWQEREDGSVVFTENGVDPIATFAFADGAAYESIQPALPVIALDFLD